MEMNPTLFGWFSGFLKANKIPFNGDGSWEDVSGETFLRTLLTMPLEDATWGQHVGIDPMYDSTKPIGVNPRELAGRVMDIRAQIAKDWMEELKMLPEENMALRRETLFSSGFLEDMPVAEPQPGSTHPEMLSSVDDSAAGGDD